ncbi:MAG: serine O-acetyltransferase [Planctomycetes bacterium]|nr:serine O-acetyltransferase [Planctomycetota bacterium]
MPGRLWHEYRTDVGRTYSDRRPALWRCFAAPFIHAGVRATLLYRVAHRCTRWAVLRPLAALLKRAARIASGCEIHPAARLGPGIHLPHPLGIVIGPTVVIEGPATIFHDVTLGARGAAANENGPRIGPYAFIYAGARVLGDLTLGERCQIGPNCVIYRDLPAGSTVLPAEPLVLEGLSFSLRFDAAAAAESARELAGT